MKMFPSYSSQRLQSQLIHSGYLMDIILLSFLCLIQGSVSSYIPETDSSSQQQTVKLVPNSFQIIIQNSIPTALPPAPKKGSSSRHSSSSISEWDVIKPAQDGYQNDLPWSWPMREEVSEDRERQQEAKLQKVKVEQCAKSCPYGLESDIEGNELCRCRDPCKGVQCFGGMKCEPQRECILDECNYVAECKADNVCLLPRPKYTFMCDKLSKRYFYDQKKGMCRKFWGCAEITGNSFDNKKECKRSCYSKAEKQRDRKDRSGRRSSSRGSGSRGSGSSSQISSELPSGEISNVIPTYKRLPSSLNSFLSEDFEEKNNHIETHPAPIPLSSIFTHQVPGLNELTGCPTDSPYEVCDHDPCSGCSNSNIMCFTSFCGKCQAIYINLQTGEASDKFAAEC